MRKTMLLHTGVAAAALALCSVRAAAPAPEDIPAGGPPPEPAAPVEPAAPPPADNAHVAEGAEPFPEPSDVSDTPASFPVGDLESAVLSVSGEIVSLTEDVIAGCRDMANDARCPEDLKIQLSAWADRFEGKATDLKEAVRAKLTTEEPTDT